VADGKPTFVEMERSSSCEALDEPLTRAFRNLCAEAGTPTSRAVFISPHLTDDFQVSRYRYAVILSYRALMVSPERMFEILERARVTVVEIDTQSPPREPVVRCPACQHVLQGG